VTENLDSSDHVSFQEAGVPAVQLFSGVHLDYHRPSDTADKIDPGGLVKVASVAREVIVYLGDREEPMTSSLTPGKKEGRRPKEGRKVSLGTIPDFSYTGKGCRISGVVPGAPAETCGLKEGDVIVRIDNRNIHSLKDLADALRTLSPGDRIMITFLREGQERTVKAEVRKR
jgi:aminopeptidase N